MTETAAHRRRILAAIGAGSVVALTGCTGSGDESTAEADESAQDDTQKPTEDAGDEENDEDEYKGLPTHPVDIRTVDEEGRPRGSMIVYSDVGSPYFESPPTDSDGWTRVDIPANIRYSIVAVNEAGDGYRANIVHSEPDNDDTEYNSNSLHVREAMTVIVKVQRAKKPEVIAP